MHLYSCLIKSFALMQSQECATYNTECESNKPEDTNLYKESETEVYNIIKVIVHS